MEAAEFTKSCKTRDNLFDVYISGVVSEVDETLCLGAKFLELCGKLGDGMRKAA